MEFSENVKLSTEYREDITPRKQITIKTKKTKKYLRKLNIEKPPKKIKRLNIIELKLI